jgi:hypothetical protein
MMGRAGVLDPGGEKLTPHCRHGAQDIRVGKLSEAAMYINPAYAGLGEFASALALAARKRTQPVDPARPQPPKKDSGNNSGAVIAAVVD